MVRCKQKWALTSNSYPIRIHDTHPSIHKPTPPSPAIHTKSGYMIHTLQFISPPHSKSVLRSSSSFRHDSQVSDPHQIILHSAERFEYYKDFHLKEEMNAAVNQPASPFHSMNE